MNEQNQFISNDLAVVSTLVYFGETIANVRKDYRGNVEFLFDQSPNLQDIIKAYSLNELSVNPRQFAVVLRDTKKIVFVQKNGNRSR